MWAAAGVLVFFFLEPGHLHIRCIHGSGFPSSCQTSTSSSIFRVMLAYVTYINSWFYRCISIRSFPSVSIFSIIGRCYDTLSVILCPIYLSTYYTPSHLDLWKCVNASNLGYFINRAATSILPYMRPLIITQSKAQYGNPNSFQKTEMTKITFFCGR